MKKSQRIVAVVAAIFVSLIMGSMITMFTGLPIIASAAIMLGVSVAMSFVPMPSGVRAGVYVEVWTRELVKQFSHAETATWIDGVPDYSRYAENDVINLVDVGGNPDVLINNTTYPIQTQQLNDGDIAISLDKFQTKPTPITDDELYALSYDKISLVKEKHGISIAESKFDKAIHAFAPASNTADTPVIVTTGAVTAEGRKRLTINDVIALKKKFDDRKFPLKGRRLVLCPDHVEDLLLTDQKFKDQYYNYTTGKIANLHSFEVYEYVSNPIYSVLGVKKSLGAVAGTGEFQSSVAFIVQDMFKATGVTKMYFSEAKTDPENQQNRVNFRHMFIALPKKQRCIGALISAYDAEPEPEPTPESVEIIPTSMEFAAAGGSLVAAVNATSAFTAAVAGTGFTIDVDGNAITVTAAANSGAQRTGTVTVTVTADDTKTATIDLTQLTGL